MALTAQVPDTDARPLPHVPGNYEYKGRTVYVVQIVGITLEMIDWLVEHIRDAHLYVMHRVERMVIYTREEQYQETADMFEKLPALVTPSPDGTPMLPVGADRVVYIKFLDALLATEFRLRFSDHGIVN